MGNRDLAIDKIPNDFFLQESSLDKFLSSIKSSRDQATCDKERTL
jgi:hypothetical protein